jgi:hypothetical protein
MLRVYRPCQAAFLDADCSATGRAVVDRVTSSVLGICLRRTIWVEQSLSAMQGGSTWMRLADDRTRLRQLRAMPKNVFSKPDLDDLDVTMRA